jgi:fatty acid desaturase
MEKRSFPPKALVLGPNYNRLLLYALEEWFYCLSLMALAYLTPAWLYPIWAVLLGGRFHAFGVVLHDLSHQSLKHKTWQMRSIEILMGYPIGTSANSMAYHHNRHHQNVNTTLDPYFRLSKKCSSTIKILKAFLSGSFFSFFWILRSALSPLALAIPKFRTRFARIFLQDVTGRDLTNHPEVKKCLKEDVGVLLFHAPMIYLATQIPLIFFLFYIPLILAGVFCIYRLLTEHQYDEVHNTHFETVMKTSFDHSLKWYDKILFTPRNIGYHAAHHLHPTASLDNLPKIRKWYLANYPEQYV